MRKRLSNEIPFTTSVTPEEILALFCYTFLISFITRSWKISDYIYGLLYLNSLKYKKSWYFQFHIHFFLCCSFCALKTANS